MPTTKRKLKLAAGELPYPAEELLEDYREMLLIRRFEERAGQLYGLGLIGGFLHLYIGQEAVVVGLMRSLDPDDTVVTSYRCHAHMLASGADPKEVMAELTGRAGGASKGKGGSMHLFRPAGGFYGGHGIVGAQVPLGTGMALAHQYRDNGAVSMTFFGDGAVNQGQVYESFNMAALWRLPVVYVIENNQFGMGTSVVRASAETHLHRRGQGFGIKGFEVDGMDVVAVRQAGEEAVAHCRAGKGPLLIEALTYRYRGHSMSDPGKYRTKEEVSRMRSERDPIAHLRQLLLDHGVTDEDALKDMDREAKASVAAAADYAQNAAEPAPEELYSDVYQPEPDA